MKPNAEAEFKMNKARTYSAKLSLEDGTGKKTET